MAPSNSYNYEQLRNLYLQAGGTPKYAGVMAAVALAENRKGDPKATHKNTNGSVDQGLWQINSSNAGLYKGQNIFDPLVNAKAAVALAEHSGNGPKNWTQFRNGEWLNYIPKSQATQIIGQYNSITKNTPRDVITKPFTTIADTTTGALSDVAGTIGKDIAFGLIIAGGGALILLGLALIGLDLGLSGMSAARETRPVKLVQSARMRSAQKIYNARSYKKSTEGVPTKKVVPLDRQRAKRAVGRGPSNEIPY